jgi:hypothetical protein
VREFDPKLWRDRAWERFKRAHVRGVPKRRLEPNWARDVVMIRNLDRIVEWCRVRGIRVVFVKEVGAVYYPEEKVVRLSHKLRLDKQVAYLLHECGHHLIGLKEDDERFGAGYPQTEDHVKRTFLHRATCLEEEFEAWHRGWKLGKRLGIFYERAAYDKIRLECIKSYIRWTLRKGDA